MMSNSVPRACHQTRMARAVDSELDRYGQRCETFNSIALRKSGSELTVSTAIIMAGRVAQPENRPGTGVRRLAGPR